MENEVVIFDGQVYKRKKQLSDFFRGAGYGLIFLALAGIFIQFYPIINLELGYRANKKQKNNLVVQPAKKIKTVSFSKIAKNIQEEELTSFNHNFNLLIPKLGIKSQVFPQIDMANEEEVNQVLKQGLAHGLGSAFPGQKKTIYIFGHSANVDFQFLEINPIFYLLDKLKAEDEIQLNYGGKNYSYFVTEKKIVSPNETSYWEAGIGERLILQTCWPPGTRWQRLLILAEPAYSPLGQI
jgi:LPXTG-site transpeptidase (sortase) family protein